jgi:hypothetical protein
MEEEVAKNIIINSNIKINNNSNVPSTRVESLRVSDSFSEDDKNYSHSNTTIDMGKDMSDIEQNEKKFIVRRPIDLERNRYPFCMVWTPLPLISWFLPFIGHTGICASDGKIYDFAGSYFISQDNMAFGNPYKYVELNPDISEQQEWDDCVAKSNERFTNEEHNIFWLEIYQ